MEGGKTGTQMVDVGRIAGDQEVGRYLIVVGNNGWL